MPIVGGGTGTDGGGWRSFVSFGALVPPSPGGRHPTACIALSEDFNVINGGAPRSRIFQFHGENNAPAITYADDQGQGLVAWQPTSDLRLKDDIKPVDGRASLANVERMRPVTFHYLADENKTLRRGFIAQELEKIDPEYVHTSINGITGKDCLTLDSNPLLMDALAAIKVLAGDVRALKEENRDLKAALINISK
ncbi:tail fiber domain-containing protein [Salmonella enterica subsp. enterica serovar Mississippi]|nr:tail fiber domain-containing protein [Salmonella enterica subsp. enterica serovar Mississippi]